MNYSQEFQQKCYNVLRFTPQLMDLLNAFRENNHNKIRFCLEDALDDEELYIKDKVTDDGDRIVCNSKISAFKDRQEIYSEYMDMLVQHLDKELAIVI